MLLSLICLVSNPCTFEDSASLSNAVGPTGFVVMLINSYHSAYSRRREELCARAAGKVCNSDCLASRERSEAQEQPFLGVNYVGIFLLTVLIPSSG